MMRSTFWAVVMVAMLHAPGLADNSVVIESRTFSPNQPNCSVAVYLSNDVPVIAIGLALEFRSISGNAYFQRVNPVQDSLLHRQLGRRLDLSPLGSADYAWPAALTVLKAYETPSENTCPGSLHTWSVATQTLEGQSPDGLSYTAYSPLLDTQRPERSDLLPGQDPIVRSGASLLIRFTANDREGCFVIDSACVAPAFHTVLVDINSIAVPLTFISGTICIDSTCFHCYCLGNPHDCSNSEIDIVDIVSTISVAFRGYSANHDTSPVCPYLSTDINCDNVTDVLDIAGVIQIAFGGADASEVLCNPCT